MQLVVRTAFLGFSLMATACASSTVPVGPKEPLRGGVLEFRLDLYDGDTIHGRVLVGATIDPLIIDSRKGMWQNMHFQNLRACGTTKPLPHNDIDFIVSPPRPEDIITLKPGTWYGEMAKYLISIRMLNHAKGPDCLEADLVSWANDERPIAKLPIRVERTDKPAALGPVGTTTITPQ